MDMDVLPRMFWSTAELADAVIAGLMRRAREDDLEQAVYGFDALAELGLHPLIRAGLRDASYGVWPEVRYPDGWIKRKKSEGKRCDLVLTPEGLPLRDPAVKETLFDLPEGGCDPENAYWLEVKTVSQFERSGPFRRYSAELLSPVTGDVKKLWAGGASGGIRHAGLLLVLLTQTQEVAEHDLVAWHKRCLDRGLPLASPAIRGFKITDRIGNGWCSAAVFGVRGM